MLVELVVGVVGGNVAAVVVIGGVGAVGICIIVNMLSIFQWPLLRSLLLLLLSSLFLQLLLSFSCWIVVVVAVAVAAIFGPRSLFSSTCTSFHPLRSLGCRKASKNESDVISRELFSSVLCTKRNWNEVRCCNFSLKSVLFHHHQLFILLTVERQRVIFSPSWVNQTNLIEIFDNWRDANGAIVVLSQCCYR